jgi:hypothetical protein
MEHNDGLRSLDRGRVARVAGLRFPERLKSATNPEGPHLFVFSHYLARRGNSPVRRRRWRFCTKNREYGFGLVWHSGILGFGLAPWKTRFLGREPSVYLARGMWRSGFLGQKRGYIPPHRRRDCLYKQSQLPEAGHRGGVRPPPADRMGLESATVCRPHRFFAPGGGKGLPGAHPVVYTQPFITRFVGRASVGSNKKGMWKVC